MSDSNRGPAASRLNDYSHSGFHSEWYAPIVVLAGWLGLGFPIVWFGIEFDAPATAFAAFAIATGDGSTSRTFFRTSIIAPDPGAVRRPLLGPHDVLQRRLGRFPTDFSTLTA